MSWYLLIHQLPPRPLYLRAKIRNRLARVGAVALKNSVYVLPAVEDCLEDLQWIAQEAAGGGGDAFVCKAEFVEGVTHQSLVRQFKQTAEAAYSGLRQEIGQTIERARAGGVRREEPGAALVRHRKRLEEIRATDFFDAAGRKEVETMLRVLENRLHRGTGSRTPRGRISHPDLVGRTWVTRRDPKVDRIASAWLIRRFVDPGARFRFIDPERETPRPHEIGFDMPGGQFTHEGDRCTFETLVARLAIRDVGVAAIGEIVHDLDLKDGKYARAEAEGVRQLIAGLVRSHPDDDRRLERGLALFEELHASYRGQPIPPPSGPGRRVARARGRSTRKSRR